MGQVSARDAGKALAVARMADRVAALEAALRAQVAAGAWHEIECEGTGRIRRAGRRALRLLGVPRGAVGPGATLPPDVVAWLDRLQRGAEVGAVLKRAGAGGGVVLRAIPMVAQGAWHLLIAEVPPSPRLAADRADARLTPRERDVLEWTGQGKSDRQIAAILGISVRTVQKHLERVYAKLGVESRLAAVMRTRAATIDAGPRSH